MPRLFSFKGKNKGSMEYIYHNKYIYVSILEKILSTIKYKTSIPRTVRVFLIWKPKNTNSSWLNRRSAMSKIKHPAKHGGKLFFVHFIKLNGFCRPEKLHVLQREILPDHYRAYVAYANSAMQSRLSLRFQIRAFSLKLLFEFSSIFHLELSHTQKKRKVVFCAKQQLVYIGWPWRNCFRSVLSIKDIVRKIFKKGAFI